MRAFCLTLVLLYSIVVVAASFQVVEMSRGRRPVDLVGGKGLLGGFSYQNYGLLGGTAQKDVDKAAAEAVEAMNNVKSEGHSSNTMPLLLTGVGRNVGTKVVAGIVYDLQLSLNIDGQAKVCHVEVTHLYPWLNEGTWSVKTKTESDPCVEYETPEKTSARRKRSLLGGQEESGVEEMETQKAAMWAVDHINQMSNSLYRHALLHISHVTKQVINGYRYRISLTTVPTSCRNNGKNNHKTLKECPAKDGGKAQNCEVSVIFSLGKYSMESFKCEAAKDMIGGDDHDYKPHGKLLGGDDHDYKPHGKLLGGDDHDYKPHGKLLGGDDHDYKPHGKLLGGDDHDYKPHGKLLGGDDHDYKPHGKLLGGDDHDYKKHGDDGKESNLLGQDRHDFIPHGSHWNGFMNKIRAHKKPTRGLWLGSGHLQAVQHMSILGGDTHDYVNHGTSECAKYKDEFLKFKATYNRLYEGPEETQRFQVFCENMKKVETIQSMERGTAKYGVTQFADLSEEEFSKQYLGLKPTAPVRQLPMAKIPDGPIPESWDWRKHNAVTPVKNQGSCGSCWAFSTTGNIEGQWAIQKNKLVSLSEQELVDCDKLDEGCNGGLPSNAYEAIMGLGGIETEGEYKYEGRDDKCRFDKSEVAVKLTGAVNISKDEAEIAAWLYHNGPISIGINAFAMQFYWGGIAHPWKFFCNPKSLDHGVLIVGYGVEDNEPYWIIKNSWGPSWGREGYYYVYRGDGTCGLNTMCTSATVE
ncbi:uncharacterized protein LOC101857656 isoform X2 [Aplysia californica]|uniref:Uncharacterized protein LOC101857656 isoform X2 n=1 Tax=Aplysia californica TaxID=6500 RepID=A0ABM1VVU8_APLCA|nr:uncharacterized protein LOC101857656 isoform X2 [Aplysia californica]